MGFRMANVEGRAALVAGDQYYDIETLSQGAIASDPMLALTQTEELHKLAEQLDVRLVGQVPLVPELREGADSGDPIASRPDTEAGAVFAEMARVLDEEMRPSKRAHPELKLLS